MKFLLNGELCEAVKCEITQSDEKISTYLLQDGSVVKVRCIVTGVWRFKDKLDQNGNPCYQVNWYVVPTTEQAE